MPRSTIGSGTLNEDSHLQCWKINNNAGLNKIKRYGTTVATAKIKLLEDCVCVCVFCVSPQHISIKHKDSAAKQESVALQISALKWIWNLSLLNHWWGQEGRPRRRTPCRRKQCLPSAFFSLYGFPWRERAGGLTGSQSISHRVPADAGTGDVVYVVEAVCVCVCMICRRLHA